MWLRDGGSRGGRWGSYVMFRVGGGRWSGSRMEVNRRGLFVLVLVVGWAQGDCLCGFSFIVIVSLIIIHITVKRYS